MYNTIIYIFFIESDISNENDNQIEMTSIFMNNISQKEPELFIQNSLKP